MDWLQQLAKLAFALEWMAVLFSLAYVFLAAKQNKWCWAFGAISSILSIALFIMVRLYAESALYGFYVVMAVMGWFSWDSGKSKSQEITEIDLKNHLILVIGGLFIAAILFYVFRHFTNAAKPLLDSTTTVFSILATYLTVKKVLSNWLYWIAIDAISVYLYWSRGLDLYALLMLGYTAMAFYGYFEWNKEESNAALVD